MVHPDRPDEDPDVESTQVLDLRPLSADATQPLPTLPPPAPAWQAPTPVPTQPDSARVDHRGTLEWDLQVARLNNRPSTDVGLLLLRLASLPLVLRGLHKLRDFSGFVDGLRENAFAAQAPELLGVAVIAGEIALPLLIAIGLTTRLAGLLQATLMVGIFVFWTLTGTPLLDPATGALSGEAELLFAAIALPLLFTGPGRVSIDRAVTASGRERRIEKRVARRLGE